mgnify:CR=1 FL=1
MIAAEVNNPRMPPPPATPAHVPTARARLLTRFDERGGLHLAFWLSLLLALTVGRELSQWWLLFGSANLLYAGLGLLLMAAAVRAAGRVALLVWGPALFGLVLAGWALLLTLIDGIQHGRWLPAAVALALIGAAVVVLVQTGWHRRQATKLATPGA